MRTDHLGYLLVVFILLAMAIFGLLFLADFPSPSPSKEYIFSLDLGSEQGGNFILGSGSYRETSYYYYYVKHADGSLTLDKADAAYSKIYMDLKYHDGESPYVLTYLSSWEFHVPQGTIIERYNGNVKEH